MWIDSHCHLNDPAFQADLTTVIENAAKAGVETMVVVGYDLASSQHAISLAEEYPFIWAAVGIHPHDAKTWGEDTIAALTVLLKHPKVVALGEIGLDYHYDYSTREDQFRAFKEQLTLAGEYHKPVIIHDREAHQDVLAILNNLGLETISGVMHCFSGSRELAREILKLGLYISFAGPLTFNNAHKLREVAAAIPPERLLVETDSPYLSPVPYRGQRNEPARVGLVGAGLAGVTGLSVAKIAEITTGNSRRLFVISNG